MSASKMRALRLEWPRWARSGRHPVQMNGSFQDRSDDEPTARLGRDRPLLVGRRRQGNGAPSASIGIPLASLNPWTCFKLDFIEEPPSSAARGSASGWMKQEAAVAAECHQPAELQETDRAAAQVMGFPRTRRDARFAEES